MSTHPQDLASTFPAGIVAQFDDPDAAVAAQKRLGASYVVTAGVDKLYAVRRLVKTIERPSDRCDASELAEKVYDLAVRLRDKQGRYEEYNLLKDAAAELEVLAADLDEARMTLQTLREEVANLVQQLATYRVFEAFPATRETPAEYGVRRASDTEDGE